MTRSVGRALLGFAVVLSLGLVAACSGSTTRVIIIPTHRPSPSTTPGLHLTATGAACRMPLGGSVTFRDPASHAVVVVQTKRVQVYTGRLASYASAYPPSHGYFVKIPVRLSDIGPSTWRIDRDWFVLHAGGLRLTMDDGNGPYSGASNVLASTFLDPGQHDASAIVIDSPSAHGDLSYEPKHSAACTWTF